MDQVKKVELVRRCWGVMSLLFKTTRFAERLHLGSESKREIKKIFGCQKFRFNNEKDGFAVY